MILGTHYAVRVLAAGGGLIMSCQGQLPDTLKQLAAAARLGGGQLTLTNCEFLIPEIMIQIAAAGSKHVTFDLRTIAMDF